MAFNTIVLIRILATLLFFIAMIMSYKVYKKKKNMPPIWLLIIGMVFTGFFDSLMNVLEWAVSEFIKPLFDILGEYTMVMFLLLSLYSVFVIGNYYKKRILSKKTAITIGILIMITVNLAGIFFFYTTTNQILEEQVINHLETAVKSRANHIETFLDGKKGRAIDFASDSFIKDSLNALKEEGTNSIQIAVELKEDFLVNKLPTDKDIYGLEVLNSRGIIVSHSGEEETEEVHKEENKFFKTVFSLGKEGIFVSDIFYDKEFERNAYVVAAPIHTGGEFLGVVIIKMGLETLAEITTDRTGLGETGEIIIINKDSLLITPSRFLGGNEGVLVQKINTENSETCKEHYEKYGKDVNTLLDHIGDSIPSFIDYIGYRGEKVLGVHTHLPENKWCMLAEIEESEVLGQPRILLLTISIVIIFITSVLISFIAIFFGNRFERRKKRKKWH